MEGALLTQSTGTPLHPAHAHRTIVVSSATACDAQRIVLAREGQVGTQVTTIEGLAARLAGGFLRGIDRDDLQGAVARALDDLAMDTLGDLRAIADLPGLPSALSATLTKSWLAGIDLTARSEAAADGRLAVLSHVEAAALNRLPSSMRKPADLAAAALGRLHHAPAVLGEVTFHAVIEIDPCWRPLVTAIATVVPTRWVAGPRTVPDWIRNTAATVETEEPIQPRVSVASCASARHEVMEALRWARSLLADGVEASAIALAAAAPGDYDDLVLALAAEANLDVHFVHGRRALTTRDGQPCAALADLLMQGLDRDRVIRLVRAVAGNGTTLGAMPKGWNSFVPRGAFLNSTDRWRKVLAESRAPSEVAAPLLLAVELIERGPAEARLIGDTLLRGSPRLVWQRALMRAPASALETTLGDLRIADTIEPAASIAWMHAATLAAVPRPHVWLLGLNSRMWPRRSREDPLLPDHIVPSRALQPRTVTEDDRASFIHILATTRTGVTCSFSRRDARGRLLGLSILLPKGPVEVLHRARVPEHALSEPDRLMACPEEFAAGRRAIAAEACWRDWHRPEITAHDGLVRSNHPAIRAALGRVHSASSLKALLRNPLGFVWKYGLGWRAPDPDQRSFVLDTSTFGTLVHDILRGAVVTLEEASERFGGARPEQVAAAVDQAAEDVSTRWIEAVELPPPLLWQGTLTRARDMAAAALGWPLTPLPGQHSHAEIDFPGGGGGAPWADTVEVPIPGTSLRIQGRIDRLDLSHDGGRARVLDYKTGKVRDPVVLDGGSELQRCLYAFAIGALMGPHVTVEAALLYPHDETNGYRPLDDQAGTLRILTTALAAAETSLADGAAVLGPDTGGDYDDLAFALPAEPGSLIGEKREDARRHLGAAADVWGQP